MRLGIKGKQVVYVTSIVAGVVVVLSLMHLARLARVSFEESQSRADLLANAILHRAREVASSNPNPIEALRQDPGLRAILESSLYEKTVTYAALVDRRGLPLRTPIARAKGCRSQAPRASMHWWHAEPSRSFWLSTRTRAGTSNSASRSCAETPSSDRSASGCPRC